MEAGIEPAEPPNFNSSVYSTAVTLSKICVALIQNIKNVHNSKKEQNIILKLLQSTNSHMLLTLTITKHDRYIGYSTENISKLIQYQKSCGNY
jgi:hypothetical protein